MNTKIKRLFIFLYIFFGVAFLTGFLKPEYYVSAKEPIKKYCLSSKPITNSGIGDMLNVLSDLIYYNIEYNRNNFISKSPEHKNMGASYLFDTIHKGAKGKKYIDYKWEFSNPKRGFDGKVFRVKWDHCNELACKIYKLLNIDKKKKEVLKKYNVPKDYFDNSMSLHIRCGDTKNKRIEPFEKYCKAIKYISEKTGADKVICFYENDDFSKKTATGIIDKLKQKFPKLKFQKCMHVDTDAEEMLMMSMCKHNIQSLSHFVKWATNFNMNPDKVIFKMNHTFKKLNGTIDKYDGNGFCDYKEA